MAVNDLRTTNTIKTVTESLALATKTTIIDGSAEAAPYRIKEIMCYVASVTTGTLTLSITDGVTEVVIGVHTYSAGHFNLLDELANITQVDSNGNKYLNLSATSDVLLTTATDTVTVVCNYELYD